MRGEQATSQASDIQGATRSSENGVSPIRSESAVCLSYFFLNAAAQLRTTVIGEKGSSGEVFIRNRWPSRVTSYRNSTMIGVNLTRVLKRARGKPAEGFGEELKSTDIKV